MKNGAAMLVALFVAAPALAQESGSSEPYIDQLRREMNQKNQAAPPESGNSVEPYIDSVKKKMGAQPGPDTTVEPFIDQQKKAIEQREKEKKQETEPANPSYTEEEKAKLPPKTEGGAIQSTLEGHSELHPHFQGEIRHAFGFRYGLTVNRDITVAPAYAGAPFQFLYGNNYAPDGAIFFEYHPWYSETYGSLGVQGSAGVSYFHGLGQFQIQLKDPVSGQPFPTTSNTNFTYWTIPLTASAIYRFNLGKYVRPYALVGPAAIGYIESRSDALGGHKGFSFGYTGAVGMGFLLDWISPKSIWDLYLEHGIKHYYLTLEYNHLGTFNGDVTYDINGLYVGFTFEY